MTKRNIKNLQEHERPREKLIEHGAVALTDHELLADPLIDRASAVILAHNHPVGALNPSEQDIETTQRLQQAGEIMGITILDHIIFNSAEYFSFLENDIGF